MTNFKYMREFLGKEFVGVVRVTTSNTFFVPATWGVGEEDQAPRKGLPRWVYQRDLRDRKEFSLTEEECWEVCRNDGRPVIEHLLDTEDDDTYIVECREFDVMQHLTGARL